MRDFDVIIIGSGVGGLISAGLLASKGLKPLVIEARTSPGGYLSSFKRKALIFDSAVDCISGTNPDGIIGRVLSFLNVDREIEFLPIEPIRRSIFPDFNVDVSGDLNDYIENLTTLFPAESSGIRDFLNMADRVSNDVLTSIDIFSGNESTFLISPDAIKLKNITYEDALREYISESRLRAALSDRCPFIGISPSRVAALSMIMLMMSYFKFGAYRPRGGFQRLSNLIVEGINRKGGKVIFANETKKIIHEGEYCQGVVCESGDEYECNYLISNADYVTTFSSLLGDGYTNIVEKMLANPGISTSFFIVYGVIKGKYEGPSSIGYFPSYDFSYFFNSENSFKDESTIGLTIASIEDRDRAPEGYHTIVLHEMVKGSNESLDKEKCAELMVRKAEKAIPDLKGKIDIIDTATPMTLQRFTGNYLGAAFGWNQLPGNFMFDAHGLKNFYIAGHWSEMGGGVLAAAYSGAKAAKDILAKEGITIGV